MAIDVRFKRVLLKVSGEALMGAQGFGIDVTVADRIAGDIQSARRLGVDISIVIVAATSSAAWRSPRKAGTA